MPPGDYRVLAYHDVPGAPARPGAGKPPQVTVRAGETATVKLVVESQAGTIAGTVVDAANQPVPDAFLSWAREYGGPGAPRSDVAGTRQEWRSDSRPVLSAADGSFQITRLPDGAYTLRAYRKGGGEAIAEHVALGATARLQIKPTGSIAGTARHQGGAPVHDLRVTVDDVRAGFKRSESFYMTGGQFTVTELPAGHFDINVEGDRGQSLVTIDLRDGETRTGVDVDLTPLVTVTGRLVEHGTQKPVPGYYIVAGPARPTTMGDTIILDNETENVSDEAGRFTLRRVPVGQVLIRGTARDMSSPDHSRLRVTRTISGTGTVDIGDLGLVRPRLKPGEPAGSLGFRVEPASQSASPEQREYKISAIDPAGPAARTALQVGDVITTCDGVDVTGFGSLNWWTLTTAPPGTQLTFGTRRGATATVVLAPRGGR